MTRRHLTSFFRNLAGLLRLFIILPGLQLVLLSGCGDSQEAASSSDTDSPADSDADGEGGSSSDGDTGGDSDSDGDSDGDEDTDDDGDTGNDSDRDRETDSDNNNDVGFDLSISLSEVIPSVGIVEWSIDKSIDRAVIKYGRDAGSFEFEAPVDLNKENYRTLLLGMKPNQVEYSVQVIAYDGDTEYVSAISTVTTGLIRNGLPVFSITNDSNPDALFGGFTITCSGIDRSTDGDVASDAWALIIDKDAEIVWWYDLAGTPVNACSRARMSFDGEHMYMGNFSNVDETPDGALMRVTLDGLEVKTYENFPERHHDFGILPNNHVLFHDRDTAYPDIWDGPDVVRDLDPETGQATVIYEVYDEFASVIDDADGSHTNYITYVPHLNGILFSMAFPKTIAVISDEASPQVLGVFGGSMSWFSNIDWRTTYVHGVHMLEDTILFFANKGENGGSTIYEYQYDLNARDATEVFKYSSGITSAFFGDVARLSNGNTFVTYCSSGVMHEVDPSGQLLREITTALIGYTEHRKTLYGAPPPWDNN